TLRENLQQALNKILELEGRAAATLSKQSKELEGSRAEVAALREDLQQASNRIRELEGLESYKAEVAALRQTMDEASHRIQELARQKNQTAREHAAIVDEKLAKIDELSSLACQLQLELTGQEGKNAMLRQERDVYREALEKLEEEVARQRREEAALDAEMREAAEELEAETRKLMELEETEAEYEVVGETEHKIIASIVKPGDKSSRRVWGW
ncbi:hypothetical protein EDC01DRAFT_667640, partial [Geopyxis carbonaria]